MKQILQLIILVVCIGCTPKIARQITTDFQSVKKALATDSSDLVALRKLYPNFQMIKRTFVQSEANTNGEKSAARLKENQITDLTTNEDNSCGFIKVVKIQPNAKMRVSYIYLADATDEGEKLADKILAEYRDGKPFADLAKQYTKDGSGKNGGDLNWFNEKHMIPDFTQAIRRHKKGDVFKTPTKEYGWYVISYTHDFKERIEYEIIEVKKDNC